MQASTNTTNQLTSTVYYTFAPLLILIILMTIISNAINILIILQNIKKCTSLNIAFLNISIFNILLVFNQTILLTFILRRGLPILVQFCHLSLVINTLTSLGIGFVHLFLAWDRYTITLKPTVWIRNRQVAWIYSTGIWVGVMILAGYDLIFYYEDIRGGISSCFVANSITSHSAYDLALQGSYLLVLIGLSVPIYLLHAKTSSILGKKARANYIELQKASQVSIGRLRKTYPGGAVVSIQVIFTLHLLTQSPYYIYNILQHALSPNSNMPLPQIITSSLSFLTAVSPLLMLSNDRYKRNIQYFLQWIGLRPKQKPSDLKIFPKEEDSEGKKFPENRDIFFSKPKDRASDYAASPSRSSGKKKNTARRFSEGSIHMVGEKKRSAVKYAVSAGLVLSAAGHPVETDFFKDDQENWLQEMYGVIEL